MSNPLWGLVGGVAFGCVSAGMMLPMSFPDKRAAIRGPRPEPVGVTADPVTWAERHGPLTP